MAVVVAGDVMLGFWVVAGVPRRWSAGTENKRESQGERGEKSKERINGPKKRYR